MSKSILIPVLLLLTLSAIALFANAQLPTTDPSQFDTQFSLSLVSDVLGSIIPGEVTRYPDAMEKAVSFYRNHYGLDISDNGARLPPGAQLGTGSSSTYMVNYAKVRGYPIVAGSQDMGVHDDTISILLTQPTVLHGAYGGKNGTWADANSALVFGFYTFFWKNNGSTAFPRVLFNGPMPMRIGTDGSLVIDCELNSNIWGKGMARGLMIFKLNPVTGAPYTSIVSSHTYPISKTDINPKCAVMTTDKDIFNEDFVTKWNNVLLGTIRDLKTAPPIAARAMAILHTAIDDALGACRRARFGRNKCSRPVLVATVSYAAHRVLSSLYPSQQDCFNSALKRALECNDCSTVSRNALVKVGKAAALAADRVLRCRDNDGSNEFVDYQFSSDAFAYKSCAPAYSRYPLLPQWGSVEPFAIQDVTNYRQGPAPAFGTPRFEADYDEVFQYGRNESSIRTFDQRRIALFWADGAGTATPPGHWNVILQSILRQQGIVDTFRISALFKLLGSAVADAGIVSWDHKYFYNTLRPITAINQRNRNLNWFPFLATPQFPEYTSGHSTFSAAAARVLSLAFGTDDITFETTSEGYTQHVRTFQKFSDAAKEAGKSRIYGGIHFEFGNVAGYNAGVAVGSAVYNQLCRNGRCLL